jgi:hypothetical protein
MNLLEPVRVEITDDDSLAGDLRERVAIAAVQGHERTPRKLGVVASLCCLCGHVIPSSARFDRCVCFTNPR